MPKEKSVDYVSFLKEVGAIDLFPRYSTNSDILKYNISGYNGDDGDFITDQVVPLKDVKRTFRFNIKEVDFVMNPKSYAIYKLRIDEKTVGPNTKTSADCADEKEIKILKKAAKKHGLGWKDNQDKFL